jgi:hypothetical protein
VKFSEQSDIQFFLKYFFNTQLAHFTIDYNVICHQNEVLNDNFLLVYYAGEPYFYGMVV